MFQIKAALKPLALTAVALLPLPAAAEDWAMKGYDPVAYLHDGQAVPGQARLSTLWMGKVWHFATEENRAAFEANPRAFVPGLQGMCVVSLAEGRAQPGDPRQFVTIGNRVYLVRSDKARQELLADPRGILMRAKANWAQIKH